MCDCKEDNRTRARNEAMNVLYDIANDPNVDPAVRVDAAKALLYELKPKHINGMVINGNATSTLAHWDPMRRLYQPDDEPHLPTNPPYTYSGEVN